MEVEHIDTTDDTISPWSADSVRSIRYDQVQTRVFARYLGMLQRVYPFTSHTLPTLDIRRTCGFAFKGCLSDLIWLQASDARGRVVRIGVESAYVFSRTGALVNPRVATWGGGEVVPVFEIVCAVLSELDQLLQVQVECFIPPTQIEDHSPTDFMALDHLGQNQLIILGDKSVLNELELNARNYCTQYWEDYQDMGGRIEFQFRVMLNPVQSLWSSSELIDLDLGDLIAIQNYAHSPNQIRLRGSLNHLSQEKNEVRHEVFIEMTEENTTLYFGRDETTELAEEMMQARSHEVIQLEIQAGTTKILFNDLCSVQEGTLVELRDHALPCVTLCVSGSPILEGELVHFQGQLMVQITKRLD